MGRPRKQPRRIVTFNLNLPLAEAIDNLPVKNRSEWMNKNLPSLLESEEDIKTQVIDALSDDELFALADSQGFASTLSTRRLIVLLVNKVSSDLALSKNPIDVDIYNDRIKALNEFVAVLALDYPSRG